MTRKQKWYVEAQTAHVDLRAALETEKARAEAAESELLDIKAIFANAEIEEAANQDMLQKAESRAEVAEKELAIYKKHIRENTISCTTCVRFSEQCNGCMDYEQNADVLLWEPEVDA